MDDLLRRGYQIAEDIAREDRTAHVGFLAEDRFHGYEDLKALCARMEIDLVEDRPFSHRRSRAFVMDVEGLPAIFLHPSLPSSCARIPALAHELSHVMLGHLADPDLSSIGDTAELTFRERELRQRYVAEMELEADMLAMLLVLPDNYFHRRGKQVRSINARATAGRLGLETSWVAARAQFYRRIHGYGRGPDIDPEFLSCFASEDSHRRFLESYIMKRLAKSRPDKEPRTT